ncbi:MAG: 2-hydroxyacyl-CoA dehydratase family protein [Thermoleophilia bacterium]|nr:2-hydroxyacyl-CoA dehydratase family protein [Thermoleophilia bacterium]
MTDLTATSLAAGMARRAVVARTRLAAFQSGTARRYLEHTALKASLELYEPGAFVPWVSYLFPPEILASYELTPMIPEVGAATLTGSEFRTEVEAAVNRLPLSRDLCSYHRAALASLEAKLLPAPSICVGTTPLCLGKECLLDGLAQQMGVPFREIHVPLPPDDGPAGEEAVARVATQLRDVHRELSRLTGRRSRLDRAVAYSNRAAAAWRTIVQGRLDDGLLLNGRQTFAFTFLGQIVWGTEAGAKGFEKLLSDRGRKDLLLPTRDGGRPPRLRLLWLHTVPHHDTTLFDLIAERDAAVVFEEMGQVHIDLLDPADPFPGLARRLIEHPLWGTASRRARLVTTLARRARIDGVIHFNHWGCRHGAGTLPVLRDALHGAGLPFLALDGDALDRPGAGNEKAAGQLESFLEML